MIRNIFFPTDFSPAADHAFVYALQFAKRLGASLTTVHVYRMPDLKADRLPNTLRDVYESMTLEEFENYKDNVPHLRAIALKKGLENIPLRHMMIEEKYSTVQAILKASREAEADLIIMGTTGASALSNILLGSTAAEVLEHANCPVLAVPAKASFDGKIDVVAMTTEFTSDDRATLELVLQLMQPFETEVHVIHIDTAHTESITHRMEHFIETFEANDKVCFKVVDATNFEEALTKYAEQKHVDILAMLTHKRNFFQELFTYSMTKKMAMHLQIPVLAIQKHNL